jgi:CRISPR/Cas system-associated exonuclease Cas4 (RecB family)
MGFHELFALGWPCTSILLISVSQVARITEVSHWYLAQRCFCMKAVWLKIINKNEQNPKYFKRKTKASIYIVSLKRTLI